MPLIMYRLTPAQIAQLSHQAQVEFLNAMVVQTGAISEDQLNSMTPPTRMEIIYLLSPQLKDLLDRTDSKTEDPTVS